MSNDQDILEDELPLTITEDTSEDKSGGDPESTTSESVEEMTLDESETVVKPTPAEISAKNQEDAWHAKIISGKAEIKDAPDWLRPRLENKLQAVQKEPEIEKIVEAKLQQEREEIRFTEMVKSLPALPKEQAQDLQNHFKELKPLGKVKALELSMKLVGLDAQIQEAEQRGMVRGRMTLPASGQPAPRKANVMDIAKDPKAWEQFRRSGYGF